MGRQYGLPYMGSKSGIADWVLRHIEPGEVFVDLFAGGCAITHAALLSRKWGRVVCNDITDAPLLFCDAVAGKYRGCDRWVSREEFFMFKDSDPFVRICWSFGNDQSSYMYSERLEPYKRALHRLFFAPTVEARRLAYREVVGQFVTLGLKDDTTGESLQSLESLERLQSLESLQSLQSLERLQKSYDEVELPEGAVVYCDPPYRGTSGYAVDFDHERFYDWVRRQTMPVYISEYWMPDDFELIDEVEKVVNRSAVGGGKKATERLYGWNVKPLLKQLTIE